MKTLTTLTLVLAGAVLFAGCSTPYSKIDGYRYYRTAIDTYPVIVTRIDSESAPLRPPVLVEPGRHLVAVRAYPTRFQRWGEQRTIELDVAPCTHYHLVAVKANPLAVDFTVKVEYEEPVPGCVAPKP